jgi:hypothetical protein
MIFGSAAITEARYPFGRTYYTFAGLSALPGWHGEGESEFGRLRLRPQQHHRLGRVRAAVWIFSFFCTAIRTTVHKICDARHGFSPFVLAIFTRGGGALRRRMAASPTKMPIAISHQHNFS